MRRRLGGECCLSDYFVGNDKPSVYAHLRGLLSHGQSPFRNCPHLVLVPCGITFGILPSLRFSFSYRGLAPHKLVGMPGIPKPCTLSRRWCPTLHQHQTRRPGDGCRSASPQPNWLPRTDWNRKSCEINRSRRCNDFRSCRCNGTGCRRFAPSSITASRSYVHARS
jgi:hypothetical protein